MPKLREIWAAIRPRRRVRVAIAAGGVVILLFLVFRGGGKGAGGGLTFTARRGPLDIQVVEGGSLQALEFQEIKCEARVGYQGIKILKIVEEGYQVTDEDIRTNKVLVELDSSELQKQITQQEIQCQSAAASLIDAQQAYEIQLNQNTSDIRAAEQKARFARMDFGKYLGEETADKVVDQLGLDQLLAAAETNRALATPPTPDPPKAVNPQPGTTPVATQTLLPDTNKLTGHVTVWVTVPPPANEVQPTNGTSTAPQSPAATPPASPDPAADTATPAPAVLVDFSKYASLDKLSDGEAMQKLRKLQDDKQTTEKELRQAETKLEGTRRLLEKGFLTKTDFQQDDIGFDNSKLKLQSAETAERLFLKYEFPKTAEETLSKYSEAVRELDRARKAAISKMAQAEAKLKSAQGQNNIQSRQLKEFKEQLAKCVITAQKPGLVVYGGAGQGMIFYGDQERIREGATVRERQSIITIPDMTKMSVKVKIHETYIKKVQKGQKARITVDAFADKVLTGEVAKVGVLPDSQNMWANPDMKVYLTTVNIDGTHDWLKPGMSAKVEILAHHLTNVVYVPVQSVALAGGKQVCYVAGGLKPDRREVQIGEANDEFVEIKSGLKEGEVVLLRPPGAGSGLAVAQSEKPAAAPAVPLAAKP